RFPSNPERRKLWLSLLNREHFTPSLHTFLCSKHFDETCFDRTGQTVRLRVNAAPTIFIYPNHMLEKVSILYKKNLNYNCIPNPGIHELTARNKQQLTMIMPTVFQALLKSRKKIWELEKKLELAHKKIKIYQQRERRVKGKCLLEEINPDLNKGSRNSNQEVVCELQKETRTNLRTMV
ncbi:unnamed protein product, partial [Staurois parvus]